MKKITDKEILDYFLNKEKNKIISARINKKNLLKNNIEYANYLENRFIDFRGNYTEVVGRILNKIEKIPACKNCGKLLPYKGLKKPYLTYCSCSCQLKDKDFIEKRTKNIDYSLVSKKVKSTKLLRYGDENYNNREKSKKTCISKYGVDCYASTKEMHNKSKETLKIKYGNEKFINVNRIKETKLKKYGNANYVNREKAKQTNKKRYGVEEPLSSKDIRKKGNETRKVRYNDEFYTNREKAKKTCLDKFGVDNCYKIEEFRKRINYDKVVKTKIKKGTINSSPQEDILFNILIKLYGENNIIKYYKNERYKNPITNRLFSCDFYIKSLDLFIELNLHFTHGKHPFDANNKEDLSLLQEYKMYNKPIYNKVIDVWTKRDVLKRTCAKENNLNYIEIFRLNFDENIIKDFIDSYLKEKKINILL